MKGQAPDEDGTNFMLAVVKGIEPRDQVEAMLAAQMAAVHNATMTFARRLAHVERRCHVVGGLVAKEHDENQLLRISVPSGDHSPGDLALSPVHA